MTHLQRLYETADGLGLQICYFPMENNTAISTPDGFIGMDVDRLEDSAGELVCLAHEMGHCLTGSFVRCWRWTPTGFLKPIRWKVSFRALNSPCLARCGT